MKETCVMNPSLASAYANLGLVIGGDWVAASGGRTTPVVNPATEEVIGELPHASTADLDRALASAQEGFRAWRATLPDQRGRILKKTADILRSRSEELARTATIESGKR